MKVVGDHCFSGYTVAYEQDEIQFPVWVLMTFGGASLYASLETGNVVLLLLSVFAGGLAYYSYPLLETGKTRLAADHRGLFIDGLGRLEWRAIGAISVVEVIERGNVYKEAEISLAEPLVIALLNDERHAPLYRRLMRRPFYLRPGPKIRVPLDILDHPPNDIVDAVTRVWLYNRSRPVDCREV